MTLEGKEAEQEQPHLGGGQLARPTGTQGARAWPAVVAALGALPAPELVHSRRQTGKLRPIQRGQRPQQPRLAKNRFQVHARFIPDTPILAYGL